MRRLLIIAAATVLTAGVVATVPASADMLQTRSMATNPVDFTPHILDGTVRAIVTVGETVVVGGDFSQVTDSTGKLKYKRENIFGYELRTGRVLPFAPKFDAPVYALAAGASNTVYAGGAFQHIDGAPQRGIAQVDLTTGTRVAAFTGTINFGDVRSLALSGSWLYVGGTFTRIGGINRVALARVSPQSGIGDAAWDPRLAAPHLSRAKIEDLAVSPNGTRLVAIGAVEQAAGQFRAQLAMFDLTTGGLADWYTDVYSPACRAGFDTYLRGVDFAPDSSYFVVVTTGRASEPNRTCDTAARFNLAGAGLHRPAWVNHTGGDSLYAVSVTGAAVYVGGHQRWQNNPNGHESAGKGAVSRVGIAALDPITGLALPWNPTRARGVGVRAMLSTPVGLIVGSDTTVLGHEYHGRIGMFPPA
jgi:hypothetical protein